MSDEKDVLLKPSGRPAFDNGDAVSQILDELNIDEVFDRAVTLMSHFKKPITRKELAEKYEHLTDTMKGQSVGNAIRSAIRKAGYDPKVIDLSILEKAIQYSILENELNK